jgi:hypothetical protein
MNASKISSSTKGNLLLGIFGIVLFVLGGIFGFFIFMCLFGGAGDPKGAVISEITFVVVGLIACYLLSVFLSKPWYIWSIFLSAPMLGLGLLFALSLTGGKDVKQDIVILSTSGFFVFISSLVGGYLGMVIKRKRRKAQN